jgi:hypothetical protein
MLRTRHKSWFGVATADMFITSEHQPLGFGGCSQWAWIDCRNRRCRSGRHEEYQAFEADVVADYDARTAVERELVPCFASLLWRMRRATAIETDLLQIQAEILSDRQYERDCRRHWAETAERRLSLSPASKPTPTLGLRVQVMLTRVNPPTIELIPWGSTALIRAAYLRHLDDGAFERLGRHEAALWR